METYDLATAQRAEAAPRIVWGVPPTPAERAREASVTLGVCAASVALVAIALIAVMALLVGAVELGTALHAAARPEVVGWRAQ